MRVGAKSILALGCALWTWTNASGIEPVAVTRSTQGFESARPDDGRRDPATLVESVTVPGRLSREATDEQALRASLAGFEAWIYDATVDLFDDLDGDGYYTYLRVRFDADSVYAEHWVYARLYISPDGRSWDEYHVTDDFLIEGSSPLDDYEVETQLVAGFPPGLYDVLIELYDADFGDYLAEFGPADSSALSLLPLEDTTFDDPQPTVIVSEHGGGGATDWPLIALLLAGIGWQARRRHGSQRDNPKTRSALSR